jgi:hypothetical protein
MGVLPIIGFSLGARLLEQVYGESVKRTAFWLASYHVLLSDDYSGDFTPVYCPHI